MRTIWQALAWKEWHEHKWKLVALTAIVASVAATPLVDLAAFSRDFINISAGLAIYCAIPLTFFVAAGTTSSESAHGTLEFTRAQPLPVWRTAFVKFLAGLMTSLAPVLLVLAAISAIGGAIVEWGLSTHLRFMNDFGNRSVEVGPLNWFLLMALTIGTSIASLYVWATALGVNRKSEVSAGSVSLFFVMVWWMLSAFVNVQPEIYQPLLASSPGGFGFLVTASHSTEVDWKIVVPIAVAVHGLLVCWYVVRFGREGMARPSNASIEVQQAGWLLPPKKSPIAAIAWKQYRESGPIVMAALAAIVGVSAITMEISGWNYPPGWRGPNRIEQFIDILSVTALYIGCVATLIVGIGVFLRDLSPELNYFWRSRPIDARHWFCTKVLTGLAVLAVAALPIAALSITRNGAPTNDSEWIFVVLVPLWTYAAAIMTICLVRHPIYAAILSWGAMSLGIIVTLSIHRCIDILNGRSRQSPFESLTMQEVAVTMIISTILFVWLAWLALKNDWGWRKV